MGERIPRAFAGAPILRERVIYFSENRQNRQNRRNTWIIKDIRPAAARRAAATRARRSVRKPPPRAEWQWGRGSRARSPEPLLRERESSIFRKIDKIDKIDGTRG